MTFAWEALRKLLQSASTLSFAVRAPSHNDQELKGLHARAQDMVRMFAGCFHDFGQM